MATATRQLGESGKDGQGSDRMLPYVVSGATSTNDAIATTLTQLTADLGGTTLDGLALMDISATEADAVGVFNATCTFGIAKGLDAQAQGDIRVGFEFGQETVRARKSLTTKRFPRPGAGTTLVSQPVGLTTDKDGKVEVEGLDVPGGAFTFSKTRIFPLSSITNSFLSTVASVDKHVNSTPFAGFAAGEVFFAGTNGNQRSDDEMEITFRFAHRPNETNIVIGDITVPSKKGWEYLEVKWLTSEDPDEPILVPIPQFVSIHQMFPTASFAVLGLE